MNTGKITYTRETACGYGQFPIAKDYELVSLKAGTLFEFGKSNLTPEGWAELDKVMKKIKGAQLKGRILITGHTCNIGSDECKQALSVDRANSVTDYLIKDSVSEENVIAKEKRQNTKQACGN